MAKKNTIFIHAKPLFGLDVERGTARVLQLRPTKTTPCMVGYGEVNFDPMAIKDGVIEQPEVVAKALKELFEKHLIGAITTKRVAMALPIGQAFTRFISVPKLNIKELARIVQTEAEQYIPTPTTDLYINYTHIGSDKDHAKVFIMAMPKQIVESYLLLGRLLGLEVTVLQTSSGACSHLFTRDAQSNMPTMLIDFDSESTDISVYDKSMVMGGMVGFGGEQITQRLMHGLRVTTKEASLIKLKYGLSYSKKQKKIEDAMQPLLQLLIKEIEHTSRYYEKHVNGKQAISQVMIMGSEANIPGLADYLTDKLRLAVRTFDPTCHIDFGELQPFSQGVRMSYTTVAGLATMSHSGVFV